MNLDAISFSKNPILRVLPALLMMLAIFLFSAGSAFTTPEPLISVIINKGSHMIGYGLLALAFWRMLEFNGNQWWIAWFLTVLYALTDEFHQSFVPGRHPAIFDALVYDNIGALIALWLTIKLLKPKQPAE